MYRQKLCDISDWSDPDLSAILRDVLGFNVSLHPKQWEYAKIYKALHDYGKLDGKGCGIGFGTSTERLIYIFAREAKKIVATDLFLPDTKWKFSRTNDPRQLVLDKAPISFPEDRVEAKCMDMRKIEFEDNSFDFAWSTCAIEHIGFDDDFVQHFNEVHRVLKEGGVYAVTTAIAFEDKTFAAPTLHFFTPEHLLDLVAKSPFVPEPVFDCSLANATLNHPLPLYPDEYGISFAGKTYGPTCINRLREGSVTTLCLLVLRKVSGVVRTRPIIVGWKESRAFVDKCVSALVKRMWSQWQYLQPILHPDAENTWFHTVPQFFGKGGAKFKCNISVVPGTLVKLSLVSKLRATWPPTLETVEAQEVSSSGWNYLPFRTDPDRCYFLRGHAVKGKFTELAVFAKRE